MSDIRKPLGRPFIVVDGKPYFDLDQVTSAARALGLSMLISVNAEDMPATSGAILGFVDFLKRVTDKAEAEITSNVV